MSDETESEEGLRYLERPRIQLVLFSVALVIAALIGWLITGWLNFWISTQVDIISIIVSAGLTLALIGVYADIAKRERIQSKEAGRQTEVQEKQAKIQDEQTNLQKRQIKLQEAQNDLQETVIELQEAQQEYMEANHKPVVQIVDWDVVLTADGQDQLKLELVNKGNGLAQAIKVKPSLGIFRETPIGGAYINVGYYLGSGSPEGIHPFASPVAAIHADPAGESGAVLQAGEDDEFRSNIQFSMDRFDRQSETTVAVEKMPFSEVLQRVNEVDSLSISLELQYENVIGEQETKEIYSEIVEPDGAESLNELIDVSSHVYS